MAVCVLLMLSRDILLLFHIWWWPRTRRDALTETQHAYYCYCCLFDRKKNITKTTNDLHTCTLAYGAPSRNGNGTHQQNSLFSFRICELFATASVRFCYSTTSIGKRKKLLFHSLFYVFFWCKFKISFLLKKVFMQNEKISLQFYLWWKFKSSQIEIIKSNWFRIPCESATSSWYFQIWRSMWSFYIHTHRQSIWSMV